MPTDAKPETAGCRLKDCDRERRMLEAYRPPRTGIHVCGTDDIEEWPVTLASFPMTEARARMVFERLLQFAETDHDVIIDLFVDDNRPDDFGIRRQMMDRVRRECEA